MNVPMAEVDLDLGDLFKEPRDLQADSIVCRVRQALDDVARERDPEGLVQIRNPEMEWDSAWASAEERGAPLLWWALHPFICAFLHVLRAWETTGSAEQAEAVEGSVRTLLVAWAATIETALLAASFPQLGVARWEEDSLDAFVAARRELVLEGHVIDTGRRRRGQIIWAPSHVFQEYGTWDA